MIADARTAARVDDVEELDSLALDRALPLDRLTVIDRFGQALTLYPNLTHERVTVVRHPTHAEAAQIADGVRPEVVEDWPAIVYPSYELEQCRFPMTVMHTVPAAIIPTDLETDLAA